MFTEIFNNIYNQKISHYKASKAIIGFFVITGLIIAVISGITAYKNLENNTDGKIIAKKENNKKIEKNLIDKDKQSKKLEVKKPK